MGFQRREEWAVGCRTCGAEKGKDCVRMRTIQGISLRTYRQRKEGEKVGQPVPYVHKARREGWVALLKGQRRLR
jgi:hypothetical protein